MKQTCCFSTLLFKRIKTETVSFSTFTHKSSHTGYRNGEGMNVNPPRNGEGMIILHSLGAPKDIKKHLIVTTFLAARFDEAWRRPDLF